MRRAILMCLIMLCSLPTVSAEGGMTIASDDNWESSGSIGGDTLVKQNSTLTISGDYTVEDGSTITVEEGSTLVVSGSALSEAPTRLALDTTATLIVPTGDLGPSGTMRITFHDEVVMDISISVNGGAEEVFTGTQYDWSGSLDGENLTVQINGTIFQINSIGDVQLVPDSGTPVVRSPENISGTGHAVVTEYTDHAWTIDVQGSLIVSGELSGVGITCDGSCELNGATMGGTGPIDVTGSISITDSTLSGSLTDEDIIIWDDGGVTWTNSTGTGGNIDNWVNILTKREVIVPNSGVVVSPISLGYNSNSPGQLVDCADGETAITCGDNIVVMTTNEHNRMVRWQDGAGELHEEDASATFTLETIWGTWTKTVDPLPMTPSFTVEMDLPHVTLDSIVESADEGTVNKRLGMMVTLSNDGAADANVMFECFTDGEDANIGMTQSIAVEAGETVEVPINWDTYTEGEKTLDCNLIIPSEFDDDTVGSTTSVSSGIVNWEEEEDSGSNLIIPITMGVIFGVLLFAASRLGMLSSSEPESKDYDEEVEIESTEEDTTE